MIVSLTITMPEVTMQRDLVEDPQAAATHALQTTRPGEEMNPLDRGNSWGDLRQLHFEKVSLECWNTLTPKCVTKLAAFDVSI